MNKDVAEKWVAKLRSGEFKQGDGYLNEGGKFCCLGVLCEVAIEDGLSLGKIETTEGLVQYGEAKENAGLPIEVQKWAGFTDGLPAIPSTRRAITEVYRNLRGEVPFHTMNDVMNYSFDDIADVIEESFR